MQKHEDLNKKKSTKDKDWTKSINIGENPYAQTNGQDENDNIFEFPLTSVLLVWRKS